MNNARAAQTDQEKRVMLQASSGEYHTAYNHLIEGDLAPIGRVHLVHMDHSVNREKHILTEMDADSNMGAKDLRIKSRKGPFKTSSGRSRVMDRSAHVLYRRRGLALEITVRRGITSYEMETLIGKLSAHRFSSRGSILFITLGGSRKSLGRLDRVNMTKLEDMVEREVNRRGTVGITVQDTKLQGALHKGYAHGMVEKDRHRAMARNFAATQE